MSEQNAQQSKYREAAERERTAFNDRYLGLYEKLLNRDDDLNTGNPFIDMMEAYTKYKKRKDPNYENRGLAGLLERAAKSGDGIGHKLFGWMFPNQQHGETTRPTIAPSESNMSVQPRQVFNEFVKQAPNSYKQYSQQDIMQMFKSPINYEQPQINQTNKWSDIYNNRGQ